MIDRKYFELINRDIDGAISPAEQAELRQYLSQNAEARDYYNELVVVSAKFKSVAPVAPPAELKSSIIAKLALIKPVKVTRPVSQSSNLLTLLNRWFIPSPSVMLTMGAVAGALIMMFAASIFHSDNSPLSSQVGGTMLSVEGSLKPVDSKSMSVGSSNVTIETKRTGHTVVASIDVKTLDASKVQISFDQSDLAITSFAGDNAVASFQKKAGEFDLDAVGDQTFRVTFDDLTAAPSSLRVKISQGDVSSEQEIQIETGQLHK